MMSIIDVLHEVGRWSIDAVWLPMLVWTAIALPIYAIQHWTSIASAHTRYWTTLGITASLPIGLIAGAFVAIDVSAVRDVTAVVNFPSYALTIQATSAAPAFSWTVWHSVGVLTVVAGLLAALRMATLIVAIRELQSFDAVETNDLPAFVAEGAASLTEQIGVKRTIRIVVSDTQPSPLTFGWRAPVVVLPRRLLAVPSDLRLALAHEFVHIRRCDYVWQWCEHLIGALFFIHPLVAVLRNEASILREITCDADVLAHVRDRSRYARLLFHYSAGKPFRERLAIGILLRESHLKTRISAMKNLLDVNTLNRSKRTALAVSISLLIVAVVAVACTDVLIDSTSKNSNAAQAQADVGDGSEDVFVIVEQMPELVGGLASVQNNVQYPESARKEGVEGRVIVQFIVNETGEVIDPKIVRGIGAELDEAALEAVRHATFKPGIQRGEPVRVKMSLPITFKLGAGGGGENTYREKEAVNTRTLADREGVDRLPGIVGGLSALQQDLTYPEVAKQAGVEGRVIVEFVVTESGTARDVRVVKGIGAALDAEARRVVRNARFVPAQKDGAPVEMKLTLPITFRLSSDRHQIIRIEVVRNGDVFLNGERLEAAHLGAKLRDLLPDDDAVVMMRVAHDAPSDVVRRAQEQIRSVARNIDYKIVRP